MMTDVDHPILFFDGECNLCNSSVQFIIKRDKKKIFRFAPIQSTAGKEALQQYPGVVPDSAILLYKGRYYTRSSAVLHTMKLLGGAWSVFYAAMIVPGFLRNGIYEFIAHHRYNWFGKRNSCMIPTPELKELFLT